MSTDGTTVQGLDIPGVQRRDRPSAQLAGLAWRSLDLLAYGAEHIREARGLLRVFPILDL